MYFSDMITTKRNQLMSLIDVVIFQVFCYRNSRCWYL